MPELAERIGNALVSVIEALDMPDGVSVVHRNRCTVVEPDLASLPMIIVTVYDDALDGQNSEQELYTVYDAVVGYFEAGNKSLKPSGRHRQFRRLIRDTLHQPQPLADVDECWDIDVEPSVSIDGSAWGKANTLASYMRLKVKCTERAQV